MASERLIKHWVASAEKDFENMLGMFENKYYSWSLFVGHLVIEKLLKALCAKKHSTKPHAPMIHNLQVLANKCELELDEERADKLAEITSFNLAARYQDEKLDFYKLCTKEFTASKIKDIKELRIWLKKLIEK